MLQKFQECANPLAGDAASRYGVKVRFAGRKCIKRGYKLAGGQLLPDTKGFSSHDAAPRERPIAKGKGVAGDPVPPHAHRYLPAFDQKGPGGRRRVGACMYEAVVVREIIWLLGDSPRAPIIR